MMCFKRQSYHRMMNCTSAQLLASPLLMLLICGESEHRVEYSIVGSENNVLRELAEVSHRNEVSPIS